ncbi:MAG: arginine--tRNA ligase [Candidatus Gastranaerophilales bacterium]|nr:arginine--tRNA ligase [Candidatus Gastranaerophilales bacterium]
MLKDFFGAEVEKAIEKAVNKNQLGQMTECPKGVLSVEKPKNLEFGDFAVNVSALARFAKLSPTQIAQEIAANLDIKDCEINVIGGFINFKTGFRLLKDLIEEILEEKETFAKPKKINKEKILLEYVSANPTGPFHIGHGRWAAMGSTLANLLKFWGHDVTQEFYINDAGSQIDKLGQSLKIRIQQELGEKIDFPTDEAERKNYYTGEYLIPIAKKYIQERRNRKAETDFLNVKILADYAKNEMENLQKTLLKDFGVSFDIFYSEQDLHDSGKVEACVKKLKEMGKLYEKDGAIWFKSSDYGDEQDRVIKKADGSNTYLTADIAYHLDKLERGYDRLINIWGADHHGYVARVRASIEALGYDPNKLEVLLGQLVNLVINGEEVRMGKRKNMVTLDELIEEVGIDATRFWMIMRNIDTTLDFDIELAKTASDENPVFYVQYAHARACSILRNAVAEKIDTQTGQKIPAPISEKELAELSENYDKNILAPIFEEKETFDSARKLILKLEEYKSLIKFSAENRQVYTICRYVQELAVDFHSFYTVSRVITEDKAMMKARLALVTATKTVLKNALDLLGVSAPEKM